MKNLNVSKWRYLSKTGKLSIVITFLSLFLTYPYVFNRFFSVLSEQILLVLVVIISLIIIGGIRSRKSLPSVVTSICLIQVFSWFLFFLFHSDSSYLVRIFFIILTYSILLMLIKSHSLNEFVKLNNNIVTIQSVLGAITFCLVLIGIIDSFADFTNTDGRTLYWFGISCSNARIGNIIRPSGFFDEPGTLACWGIYALIFNKLFYNNKKVEICLTVSLFFTLSVAYFIQIFFYFLFFSSRKRILVKLLIVGVISLFVYKYIESNDILRYMTIDRFEGGNIRSERNELAEMAKVYFLKNPYMGIGAKNLDAAGYMADNQYEILAKDGILGTAITYLPLLYILIKFRGNVKILYALFIIALGYLQRPFHITEMHYVVMYTFVVMVVLNYRKNTISHERTSKSNGGYSLLQLS